MAAEVITTDDLREFRMELLEELQTVIKQIAQKPTKRWLKSPQVKNLWVSLQVRWPILESMVHSSFLS